MKKRTTKKVTHASLDIPTASTDLTKTKAINKSTSTIFKTTDTSASSAYIKLSPDKKLIIEPSPISYQSIVVDLSKEINISLHVHTGRMIQVYSKELKDIIDPKSEDRYFKVKVEKDNHGYIHNISLQEEVFFNELPDSYQKEIYKKLSYLNYFTNNIFDIKDQKALFVSLMKEMFSDYFINLLLDKDLFKVYSYAKAFQEERLSKEMQIPILLSL